MKACRKLILQVFLQESFLDTHFVSKTIDYKHDPNAPKLPELQIEIWNAMEHADDKCYENSFKIKLARYELRESFERLIDSLYPR